MVLKVAPMYPLTQGFQGWDWRVVKARLNKDQSYKLILIQHLGRKLVEKCQHS